MIKDATGTVFTNVTYGQRSDSITEILPAMIPNIIPSTNAITKPNDILPNENATVLRNSVSPIKLKNLLKTSIGDASNIA